jgi:hypothetical protein
MEHTRIDLLDGAGGLVSHSGSHCFSTAVLDIITYRLGPFPAAVGQLAG